MTTIQQRGDLASVWALRNPVLARNEVGWEEDTNSFKRGDGVTVWNSLPYVSTGSGGGGGGAVTSVAGRVGAVVLSKSDVGLSNVDNTSDANKPVSTAAQTALNLKANLASPAFSGTPTAPTQAVGDDTTRLATTAFVKAAIAAGGSGGGSLTSTEATNWNLALSPGLYHAAANATNSPNSNLSAGFVGLVMTSPYQTGYTKQVVWSVSDQGYCYTRFRNNTSGGWGPWANQGTVSPALTGIPTAPTATAGTNTTQIATTAFVAAAVAAGGGGGGGGAPVTSVAGKTGAVTLVKGDVGLANVDNTSDADKPVSTATQNAINSAVAAALLASNPVGSIEINTTNTNPSAYIGGTWVAWGSGRVPVGVNTSDTDFNASEKTGGAKTHTLTEAELASHTHIQDAHGHFLTVRSAPTGFGSTNPALASNTGTTTSQAASIQQSTATNQNTGGGQPHNNMQPYITCYMFKRTA